jgi:hypothetical protein
VDIFHSPDLLAAAKTCSTHDKTLRIYRACEFGQGSCRLCPVNVLSRPANASLAFPAGWPNLGAFIKAIDATNGGTEHDNRTW